MNHKYFFPVAFLVGELSIIFLCAIYLCGCPGAAQAEESQTLLQAADHPFEDGPTICVEVPLERPRSVAAERAE